MSQLDSLVELDWVSQLASLVELDWVSQLDSLVELASALQLAFSAELVWVALRTGSAYTWNSMGTDYSMALP